MPFSLNVLNPFAFPAVTPRRVTLVHFARATRGFADKTAPDLDNRGGVIRAGHGAAHGPVTGLIGNATGVPHQHIKIKVVRDRLEPTAQLFPELESSADVSLVFPSPGQPLNPAAVAAAGRTPARDADCVYLESASAGDGDPETKLKLRFGSATGPVIAEMGIVVYKPKILFIQVHLVTINGPPAATNPAAAAPALTGDQIRTVFRRMDRIYAQAGIRVVLRSTFLPEAVNGYTEQGTVTLPNGNDHLNSELQNILNQHPNRDSMNAYIFNRFRDVTPAGAGNPLGVVGIAMSRTQANRNLPVGPFPQFPGCQAGFTLAALSDLSMMAHTAAHEIGHTLELEHYGRRGNLTDMIDEIWSNRNLMKNQVDISANAAVNKVGYGRFDSGFRRAGSWLGTKSIPTDGHLGQADQIRTMRLAHGRDSYKPVRLP